MTEMQNIYTCGVIIVLINLDIEKLLYAYVQEFFFPSCHDYIIIASVMTGHVDYWLV